MHSPEITVVLLCCKVYLQTSTISDLKTFVCRHTIQWQRVYQLCAKHRVRPLVLQVLTVLQDILPPDALQLFKAYGREFSLFTFDRKITTDDVLALLEQQGVDARLYKGMDLSQLLYRDIAMREFTDMDIIIEEKHAAVVAAVMQAEGYTMHLGEYFKLYPDHFKHACKDVLFGKRCARGRRLSFEFHYRPTKDLMAVQYSFSDLLGADYLTRGQFSFADYYKLMLVNNGASDFYPNLRSLLDMVILYRNGPFEIPPALRPFEELWQQLAALLLGYPERAPLPDKTGRLLLKRLLHKRPAMKYTFLQQAFVSITFSQEKFAVFRQYLQFLLKPNGHDLMLVRLPHPFLYYLIKPFRLTLNAIRRLK